jgi:carbon monoxide dehydrogenase subunit G
MGTNRRTTRAATLAGVILAAGIATTGVASAEGAHSATTAGTHQRITSAAQLQAGIQLAVAGERALGPALLGTGPVGFLEN